MIVRVPAPFSFLLYNNESAFYFVTYLFRPLKAGQLKVFL